MLDYLFVVVTAFSICICGFTSPFTEAGYKITRERGVL